MNAPTKKSRALKRWPIRAANTAPGAARWPLIVLLATLPSLSLATMHKTRITTETPMIDHDAAEEIVATQRDQYGRIRVPALINGKGPFSLIFDTGANNSAVSSGVANELGAALNEQPPMIMHGVTGSVRVPSIRVDSIAVGGFSTRPSRLPIVLDALDGADGFLSTASLPGQRIVLDLQRNLLVLRAGRSGRDGPGFVKLRVELSRSGMLMFNAVVDGVRVKSILDTGAQATIGNMAMRDAITHQRSVGNGPDEVIGASSARHLGHTYLLSPFQIGSLWVVGARVSYGDMPIFGQLDMTTGPAMLIGMDVLGQFDAIIFDYADKAMLLRPRRRVTL